MGHIDVKLINDPSRRHHHHHHHHHHHQFNLKPLRFQPRDVGQRNVMCFLMFTRSKKQHFTANDLLPLKKDLLPIILGT